MQGGLGLVILAIGGTQKGLQRHSRWVIVGMLLGMLASKHLALGGTTTGLFAAMGLIVALEANALFGGQGPMKSVSGVIHSSLALTIVVFALLNFL